jgi:hypothetical protein
MVYTLRSFFSSKCSLFHNSNLFGSCIIHILFAGCVKIKKNNSGAKGLSARIIQERHVPIVYRDSVVDISTHYGLDRPGVESGWEVRNSAPVQTRTTLGTNQPPIHWVPGLFRG